MKVVMFGRCQTRLLIASALVLLATVFPVCTGSVGWAQTLARMDCGIVSGSVPAEAPAASCPAEGSPSVEFNGGSTTTIHDTTNKTYHGTVYTPSANRTICRVCWELDDQGGDLSTITYYTEIFEIVSNNLKQSPDNTPVYVTNGRSDPLTGSASWDSQGWRCTEWSGNKPTLTSGTGYAVVLKASGTSPAARAGYGADPAGTLEDLNWYDSNGDRQTNFADFAPSIRIYHYE